jgi:HSP20 family protein
MHFDALYPINYFREETKRKEQPMAEKPSSLATRGRENERMMRRQSSPFSMLERFADEMDRMFDEFGLGRGWGRPTASIGSMMSWTPSVEVSQRNNELVIRADLPGMAKDDVKVDVSEDSITIQGERKKEQEEERGGIYRSERSYGSFYRVIGLPEGAMTDQAKATFKDGVLEITMPAPPDQVSRGRRLEISETTTGK